MHNELKLATSDLSRFLQVKLPELSEDWWEKHVVDRLSFQQQRVIGEKNISSLRELDFAALLRVLDQNWYDLSGKFILPREARNWVKELQTVRNKWAHMSAEETPASEVYRDADTLGRLLELIGAHPLVIDKAFHIQTINSLHERFERFMEPFRGPATKNLTGYASWFIARSVRTDPERVEDAWDRLMAA